MRSSTGGRVSQGFSSAHQAVDIVNAYKSPLASPINGTVRYVGPKGSGTLNAGNVVEIVSGNQMHRLCHLASAVVVTGQTVKEGQLVGYMGFSGYTVPRGIAGTHLHHILEIAGRRQDIRRYVTIPPTGSTVITPPKVTSTMPSVGSSIQLVPQDVRTTYRAGTTIVAGTIRVTDNSFVYRVRGYDPKYPGRIIINSASAGGNGVSLALFYTSGALIPGWRKV